MRLSAVGRVAALGALVAAIALVAIILFGGSDDYRIKATFINGGQLVKGNPVQSGGVAIGSVKSIKITDNGQAEVDMTIQDDKAPLRVGTHARIRQFSQSGIANRYVDLDFPSNSRAGQTIESGGTLSATSTTTQVDLDQLFNTLDPPTRKALQDFFKGSSDQFKGKGALANKGFEYLNPALATSRRLFGELNRDTPVLERFLIDSSRLVTALGEKRDDLSGLVGNLNTTTRALANQKQALAESVGLLPPVMRRANTTFVNLRAALDETDPLVDASKPVARRLQPFLSDARKLAADAEPTVKDLRKTIRRRGPNNDLIELTKAQPPLAKSAVDASQRRVSPGGTPYNVGTDNGAFPESVKAFRGATPIIAQGRPYTTDLFGWFDDFSTTGPGFDALGANARAAIRTTDVVSLFKNGTPDFNLFGLQNNLGPVRRGNFKPCPGASEAPAADGSNVFSAEEAAALRCDPGQRHTGDTP
jgi:phospholipid/cholesterol/gamma-HCH transport system substrate-binding protein